MPRTWSLFLVLFLVSGLGLYAQEESPQDESPDLPAIESDWGDYNMTLYTRGDKNFVITLGIIIPTYVSGKEIENNDHGISLGGTGTLGYHYFFTSNIFIGGELSGMFAGTRAGNMLYIVPFGVRVGYQFIFRRFEFPISLMVGGAGQRYLDNGYFGLILKPQASVFWRFNPEWSFGLNGVWWFVPQFPKNGYYAYGNFLEITLTARYHF